MSDNLRKGFGDQIHDKAKPDSQKTYTESATDTVTGLGDKAAGALQPEGEKSTTQKIGDSTRGNADGAQNSGASLVDQAKDAIHSGAQYISDNVSSTTDSAKSEADKTTST